MFSKEQLFKLAPALLTVPVQLCRCIKIHTSEAFIFSCYSNTKCFGPPGSSGVQVVEEIATLLSHFYILHFKGIK
jgi:hypothetical protein